MFAGILVPMIENVVVIASVLSITTISIERYYAVCQPLRARTFTGVRRTVCILVIIWSVAIITCVPFSSIAIYKVRVFIIRDIHTKVFNFTCKIRQNNAKLKFTNKKLLYLETSSDRVTMSF